MSPLEIVNRTLSPAKIDHFQFYSKLFLLFWLESGLCLLWKLSVFGSYNGWVGNAYAGTLNTCLPNISNLFPDLLDPAKICFVEYFQFRRPCVSQKVGHAFRERYAMRSLHRLCRLSENSRCFCPSTRNALWFWFQLQILQNGLVYLQNGLDKIAYLIKSLIVNTS